MQSIVGGEVARRILFITVLLSICIIIDAAGEMSAVAEEDDEINVQHCASCGIAEIDDIKLKDCDDCDLVKYCSDQCQEDHRPDHEQECEKRAAEIYDEILFKQPESNHYGDCPICCLPIPIDVKKSGLYLCCSKRICKGCDHANQKRERERRLQHKCAFCRKAVPETDEETNELLMKRVEANDPVAIQEMGTDIYYEGDYEAAFEYWTRAVDLGDTDAHYQLSTLYRDGLGVEKDEKKQLHHLKQAAISGDAVARHYLGWTEEQRGRMDRAVKHYIIAAKLGYDDSLESVKDMYKDGHVNKEDFATALRGHHAAIAATESPQREAAAEFIAEKKSK